MIAVIILIAAVVILAGWGAYEILARRRGARPDDEPPYLPAPAEPEPAAQPRLDYDAQAWETVARLAAQAEAEAAEAAAHEAAAHEPWGEWDEPTAPVPLPPPPPMPPGSLSRIMVNQIAYPDPADMSYDKDRKYRELYKRTGVATGTRASQEDTGVWALPALEPGDGTGRPL